MRDAGVQLVSLNGFAGDMAAGDASGQGQGGSWWAVTPTGAKASASGAGMASSAASSSASSAGGSGW